MESKNSGYRPKKEVFSGEGRMRGWDFESIYTDEELMVPND